MIPATPSNRFGRRTRVSVLAVIAVAVAVAMVGLLVAKTSRHKIDGARMNVAGRQRMLGERLIALTLLARGAAPEARALWRPRIDATVTELRAASQQLLGITAGDVVIPPNTAAAREDEVLLALQDSVKESVAMAVAPDATFARIDSLLAQEKRLAVSIEHVVDALELEWGHEVDRLLLLES